MDLFSAPLGNQQPTNLHMMLCISNDSHHEGDPVGDVDAIIRSVSFAVNLGKLPQAKSPSTCRNVLLTGATGFLGCEVLCFLLSQTFKSNSGYILRALGATGPANANKLTVYCLVRSTSDDFALQRIRLAVEESGRAWPNGKASAQIVPVAGDFEKQYLGLNCKRYEELARTIDVVYHMGGRSDVMATYRDLRSSNTLSVENIIDFCVETRQKKLHFASSLAVFPGEWMPHAKRSAPDLNENMLPSMDELKEFVDPEAAGGGMSWTKWVAEVALREIRARGLPIVIYRLPRMFLCSRELAPPHTNSLWSTLLVAAVNSGHFPISPIPFPLTPVDVVAWMMVEVSLKSTAVHWLYHILDTKVPSKEQLERWGLEMGISWRGVDWRDFRENVIQFCEKQASNAADRPPSKHMLMARERHDNVEPVSSPRDSAESLPRMWRHQPKARQPPVDVSLDGLRRAANFSFEFFGGRKLSVRNGAKASISPVKGSLQNRPQLSSDPDAADQRKVDVAMVAAADSHYDSSPLNFLPISTVHLQQDLFLPGDTVANCFSMIKPSLTQESEEARSESVRKVLMGTEWGSVLDATWPSHRSIFVRGLSNFLHSRLFIDDSPGISGKFNVDSCLADAQRMSAGSLCNPSVLELGISAEQTIENLRRLFKQINDGNNATAAAKTSIARLHRMFIQNLAWMEKMVRTVPSIEVGPVEHPVFIVGVDLGGMAFLQQLLAKDTSCRAPTLCEMMMPYGDDGNYCPVGLAADAPWDTDPRVTVCREVMVQLFGALSETDATTNGHTLGFGDDFLLLDQCGRGWAIPQTFSLDGMQEWLLAATTEDISQGYAMHRKFLQHLQYQRATTHWILQSPYHLLNVEALRKLYPSASFIFLHRDPVAALSRWCALEAAKRSKVLQFVDPLDVGRSSFQMVQMLVNKLVSLRSSVQNSKDQRGQSRFVDVYSNDLSANPMQAVRHIYKTFGWTQKPLSLALMRKAVEKRGAGLNTLLASGENIKLGDLEWFGITTTEAAASFAEYCRAVQIRSPSSVPTALPTHTNFPYSRGVSGSTWESRSSAPPQIESLETNDLPAWPTSGPLLLISP